MVPGSNLHIMLPWQCKKAVKLMGFITNAVFCDSFFIAFLYCHSFFVEEK